MLMTKWTILILTFLFACGQRKNNDSITDNYPVKNKKELTGDDKQIIDDFKNRRLTFDNYLKQGGSNIRTFTCPSCGFPTLDGRGDYEICTICDWEDDGQDDSNADDVLGGPNHDLSLTDSRLKIGRELKVKADSLKGKVVTDPGQFFKILNEHEKRMKIAESKIKDDTDINDPLWDNWRQTRELIKRELIKSK